MILFETIRWKNFLSTGNSFTEINFTKNKSTLIVGENGAGKSTILDALCFGLYGKPFRKINKPLLINAINQKGLEVEIEFKIGKKSYKVRRGIKPSIFEIYQDGNLLNQDADSKEYQETFEKNILKLNFKSFSQIVILGSASFVPFMQLSAANRREVIEDLLDIQIFTTMNTILKEKISTNKNNILSTDYELKLTAEKIEMHKKHLDVLKQNNETLIKQKEEKIDEYKEHINATTKELTGLVESVQSLQKETSQQEKVQKKINNLTLLRRSLNDKIDRLNEDIKFFNNHHDCPTCKQGIEHDHKSTIIDSNKKQIDEVQNGLIKLEDEWTKNSNKLTEIKNRLDQIAQLNIECSSLNTKITTWNQFIGDLQKEIESINKQNKEDDVNTEILNSLKHELKVLIARKEELSHDKNVLDVAQILLKDTGIKTKIIKQYIPIINKLINKYLAAMDFFVNFELNENFEEKIKSRHRDEFSYESFSEGEKLRIDLSLLFTWRAVAKLRNSASTNLLIMDEVFDSSLDASGTDEFLKLLQGLANDTNVFIISHKGDTLFDKFDSVIRFEKVKNFSRIAI